MKPKFKFAKCIAHTPKAKLTIGKVYEITGIPRSRGIPEPHGIVYYWDMDNTESDKILCIWIRDDRNYRKAFKPNYFELSEDGNFGVLDQIPEQATLVTETSRVTFSGKLNGTDFKIIESE